MAFAHLHVHTAYSLLDGACKIDTLVDRAKNAGQTALAITDHGVMYGAVDFYKACINAGIKPIIGCEVYVANTLERVPNQKFYHLVLLAKNNIGYQNLLKIVTVSHTNNFYYKPRVDKKLLAENCQGLIAMSACIAGEIPQAILENEANAEKILQEYLDIFGKENFYLELQNHNLESQRIVNRGLYKLAKKYNLEMVATNDVHYISKEDALVQDVLMCIQMKEQTDNPNRLKFETDEFYLKSENEMLEAFPTFAIAVENTVKIADLCNVTLDFSNRHLPKFNPPNNRESREYLNSLCQNGLKKRYPEAFEQYKPRLDYELSVIEEMGFVDYFLVVWDFISYAKKQDIPVGPGRGSAGGSIVAFSLGITNVDPMKYNLIFERFLNKDRKTMPDIDTDFCIDGRGDVINYVIKKYGNDKVAQIIAFDTFKSKGAVRDVARVLGASYQLGDNIAKNIPYMSDDLEYALKTSPELQKIYQSPDAKKVMDTAMKIQGLPRHPTTHAAGVVITDTPLYNFVPLQQWDETPITQYPMGNLEELGLLKMDFLGLRNLTVIKHALKNAKLTLNDIDYTDKKTYAMLSKGDTLGVFQLESDGMRDFLTRLKPECLEDIIAGISLYRPGPMDSIPLYIRNKKLQKTAPDKITYEHPLLKDILEVTYGCLVYQEQVMQIAQSLGGYTMAQADNLRRAMSKKKTDVMRDERVKFVTGCGKNNIPAPIAHHIFDSMESFALYAFNKSHAAGYAQIAFQTAFLKCNYKTEFMAALLTSEMNNTYKMDLYITECRNIGIKVLLPDINKSNIEFTVENGNIRVGFGAIKNIGIPTSQVFVEERKKRDFHNFNDFCVRISRKCPFKKIYEMLIKCGAFDNLGECRKQLLAVGDLMIEQIIEGRRNNLDGQIDLLETQNQPSSMAVHEDYPAETKLYQEFESLGVYVTMHPYEKYKELFKFHSTVTVEQLENKKENDRVEVGGIITEFKTIDTAKGKIMGFITLSDCHYSCDVIVFPTQYNEANAGLKVGDKAIICGRISKSKNDINNIVLEDFQLLEFINFGKAYLKVPDNSKDTVGKIKSISAKNSGINPLFIYNQQTKKTVLAPKKYWIDYDLTAFEEFKSAFGEENFVMKTLI